jgi:hypothetical protein
LKYAGATAAVVGASALGLDYVSQQNPSTISPTTLTTATAELTTRTTSELRTTSASFITSTQPLEVASIQGRLFFDYNGNGDQEAAEPDKRVSISASGSFQSLVEG